MNVRPSGVAYPIRVEKLDRPIVPFPRPIVATSEDHARRSSVDSYRNRGASFAPTTTTGESYYVMATSVSPPAPAQSRGRRPSGRRGSLIDWRDPDRNNEVLDWRRRAQDYGLLPVSGWS